MGDDDAVSSPTGMREASCCDLWLWACGTLNEWSRAIPAGQKEQGQVLPINAAARDLSLEPARLVTVLACVIGWLTRSA